MQRPGRRHDRPRVGMTEHAAAMAVDADSSNCTMVAPVLQIGCVTVIIVPALDVTWPYLLGLLAGLFGMPGRAEGLGCSKKENCNNSSQHKTFRMLQMPQRHPQHLGAPLAGSCHSDQMTRDESGPRTPKQKFSCAGLPCG
eukprot:351992-Chlamydomonas_euryale.AAC.5